MFCKKASEHQPEMPIKEEKKLRIYEKKDEVARGKNTGILDGLDDMIIVQKEAEEIGPFSFAHSGIKTAIIDVPIIGRGAFEDCKFLKEVVFSKNVLKIEEEAFYRCESLTRVIMPENLISIGAKAFAGCFNIEKMTFSERLKEIDDLAFLSCESLNSVKINADLQRIGNNAFAGCVNLNEVDFSGGNLILEPHKQEEKSQFNGDVRNYISIANSPFLECGKIEFLNFQTFVYDSGGNIYRESYNRLMKLWMLEESGSFTSMVVKRILEK